MNSDRENEQLRDLEEQLAAEDPTLAESLRALHWRGRLPYRRWAWNAALVTTLVLAVICLMLGELGVAALLGALALILGWARQRLYPAGPSGRQGDSGWDSDSGPRR
ncbi:MAG: DUF3040 domain-containing protein [Pseudonocardiaceae bacterium]|nr:DUF3040 domain-containing protein [Pseudonocardiaceae bacterium]